MTNHPKVNPRPNPLDVLRLYDTGEDGTLPIVAVTLTVQPVHPLTLKPWGAKVIVDGIARLTYTREGPEIEHLVRWQPHDGRTYTAKFDPKLR
jgi:hypothetical protein